MSGDKKRPGSESPASSKGRSLVLGETRESQRRIRKVSEGEGRYPCGLPM